MLRFTVFNNNIEIMNILIKKNINLHIDNDILIEWCEENKYNKIYEIIKNKEPIYYLKKTKKKNIYVNFLLYILLK